VLRSGCGWLQVGTLESLIPRHWHCPERIGADVLGAWCPRSKPMGPLPTACTCQGGGGARWEGRVRVPLREWYGCGLAGELVVGEGQYLVAIRAVAAEGS
jgi:hypothetical protein